MVEHIGEYINLNVCGCSFYSDSYIQHNFFPAYEEINTW